MVSGCYPFWTPLNVLMDNCKLQEQDYKLLTKLDLGFVEVVAIREVAHLELQYAFGCYCSCFQKVTPIGEILKPHLNDRHGDPVHSS